MGLHLFWDTLVSEMLAFDLYWKISGTTSVKINTHKT